MLLGSTLILAERDSSDKSFKKLRICYTIEIGKIASDTDRTYFIFPLYSYYKVLLEREETQMAFGNVDGAACGCGCDHGKGFGAGIAAVVIIILLLIAMGIVF